ncbi:hypothetical protein [Zoogloea sp.]|uniref:hypothetical protein n=1 Tax=Zoogloea sp. TaxID=49181 RepID=UPI0035AEC6B0
MTNVSLAGGLHVRARWADGCLNDWRVDLHRPPVAKALVGLAPDEALSRIPMYYSLCAHAQREAGRLALLAAGRATEAPVAAWQLWAECLHEHLWRLLLDWPRCLGVAPQTAAFAGWRSVRGHGRAALVAATARVLDETFGGDGSGGLLEAGLSRLDADGASALRTGLDARLTALRAALESLAADEVYPHGSTGQPGAGQGEAWIHTARGALRHELRLDGGRIAGWRVEAPTDRNFASETGIVKLLPASLPTRAAAQEAVERAVLLLDPCVAYEVEIADA